MPVNMPDREILDVLWFAIKQKRKFLYERNLENTLKPVIYTTGVTTKALQHAVWEYCGGPRQYPPNDPMYGAATVFEGVPIYEVDDNGNSHKPWRIALVEIK